MNVRLAPSLLALPLLVRSLVPAQFDTDRYWLAWLGERILRTGKIPRALGSESPLDAGHPWIAHEWLYALLAAYFRDHHAFALFAVLNAVAVAALLFACAWLCERYRANPVLASAVLGFTAFVLLARFSLRAENASDAALAALFPLAVSRFRWALPVMFALWANLHAGFAMGLVLLAVWLALERGALFERAALFAACAFATLATPFGAALWAYVWWVPHSWIPRVVQEWQPGWRVGPFFIAVLALPALAALRGISRERAREFALYAVTFAAALAAMRNVPVACALGLPCGLAAVRTWKREIAPGVEWIVTAGAAAGLLVTTLPGGALARDAAFGLFLPSRSPVLRLSAANFEDALVACEEPFLCNVVLLQNGRTTYDGRTDPFPWPRAALADAAGHAGVLLSLRDLGAVRGFTRERWNSEPALYTFRRAR